jgi:hypothetical protein
MRCFSFLSIISFRLIVLNPLCLYMPHALQKSKTQNLR